MEQINAVITNKSIMMSVAIIIIGIVVYTLLSKTTNRLIKTGNKKINNKQKTYARLFRNIIKYLVIIIVCVLVLQINGINVSSLIAGLGLVSVIAGLALQDALKDIIMGFNIIVDGYFTVGDVLKIDNNEYKVIELGLKRTKMQDINNNNIYVVANRNISQALTLSEQFDIDIPLPYEENAERMEEVINQMMKEIYEIKNVIKVEYKSISEFGDSAIFYKIRIYCNLEFKAQIKREANRIIKIELDKNKISIPYTQIDVHTFGDTFRM